VILVALATTTVGDLWSRVQELAGQEFKEEAVLWPWPRTHLALGTWHLALGTNSYCGGIRGKDSPYATRDP